MKDRKEMINRLHEIADGLSAPLTDDLTSIRSLHEVAREITSLADSIGRRENVDIDEVWPDADDRSILKRYRLPIYLGITSEGEKLVFDLARMPHLLVGGKSGYGKTNLLNSIVCGLVRLHSPRKVRFVLFDPKCTEFTSYCRLPHLAFHIITEANKCMYALLSLIREMERRLKMFASVACRNIDDFNSRKSENDDDISVPGITFELPDFLKKRIEGMRSGESADIPDEVPHIVVVMDEIADSVSLFGEDFIALLKRLASKGRSAGIHIVATTESVNDQSLPLSLRECFPSRIAFKTNTQDASRILLDLPDADALCSRGDILIRRRDEEIVRSQNAYLRDGKIAEILAMLEREYPASTAVAVEPGIFFRDGQCDIPQNSDSQDAKLNDEELCKRALDVIYVTKRASISHFQRQLNIGFNQAARLVGILEERGIIGQRSFIGVKFPLEVLHEMD